MSKHTPGNWIDWNDEEDNWLLVQEDTQQVIALFPKGDTESTKDEALANCQLCAAAPELLAALKALLAYADAYSEKMLEIGRGAEELGEGADSSSVAGMARAAIAKAEGR